jgi:hypothetical protein
MILFCLVLLEHLLYDFHWQGQFISDNKGKRIFLLFVHCLTWALLLWLTGYFMSGWGIEIFLFLFITHFVCDYWKSHQPRSDANFYQIYIDQGVHLLSIVLAVIYGVVNAR